MRYARWAENPSVCDYHDEDTGIAIALSDGESRLEAALIKRELLCKVGSFYESLPDHLRDTAYRFYWLNQAQGEIAIRTGVTQAAVSQRIQTIIRRGRRYFGIASH